jgi:hypothetical protein
LDREVEVGVVVLDKEEEVGVEIAHKGFRAAVIELVVVEEDESAEE